MTNGAYRKIDPLTGRMYLYLKSIQKKHGDEFVTRDALQRLAEGKKYKYKSIRNSLKELEYNFVDIAYLYNRTRGGGLYHFIDLGEYLKDRVNFFRYFDSLPEPEIKQ